MARTTLDIDEAVLEMAMESSSAKTKTKVLGLALQVPIRQRRRCELIESLGTYELDLDLEELRRLCRGRLANG